MPVRAVHIVKDDEAQRARLVELGENQLGDGDVTVAVEYSAVTFQDGLESAVLCPLSRRSTSSAGSI